GDQNVKEGVGAEIQEHSEEIEEDIVSENDFGDNTTEKRSDSDEDLLLRDMMEEARRNLKRKRSSKAERKPRK
ncbi:hypothetical protein Dimus_001833, partial [Dionaea muscipula]